MNREPISPTSKNQRCERPDGRTNNPHTTVQSQLTQPCRKDTILSIRWRPTKAFVFASEVP